jgi:hypothetical protein
LPMYCLLPHSAVTAKCPHPLHSEHSSWASGLGTFMNLKNETFPSLKGRTGGDPICSTMTKVDNHEWYFWNF